MTSFEATPHSSTAEEAARIALVALHGALADDLPRDWNGPYRIKSETQSIPTSQAVIDYMMRIAPKPVRLTGDWHAVEIEVELEAFDPAGNPDDADEDDWRSFQQSMYERMTDTLVVSSDGTASIIGGDAYTTATLAGIREFFLTYDLRNAFTLIPHLRVEGITGPRQFKALRFKPHRGRSSIQLIDL